MLLSPPSGALTVVLASSRHTGSTLTVVCKSTISSEFNRLSFLIAVEASTNLVYLADSDALLLVGDVAAFSRSFGDVTVLVRSYEPPLPFTLLTCSFSSHSS